MKKNIPFPNSINHFRKFKVLYIFLFISLLFLLKIAFNFHNSFSNLLFLKYLKECVFCYIIIEISFKILKNNNFTNENEKKIDMLNKDLEYANKNGNIILYKDIQNDIDIIDSKRVNKFENPFLETILVYLTISYGILNIIYCLLE